MVLDGSDYSLAMLKSYPTSILKHNNFINEPSHTNSSNESPNILIIENDATPESIKNTNIVSLDATSKFNIILHI